ncbi:hypothetical protein [Alkalibacterium olivapovliticus]|uniref:Uncharacterized protein n=1 Tax=Alkalibacterium olivapovliticus TaxID=99907 RepID=A0A2T0W6C6_9LACT|nr:hypothetical protein [Alkalibacterium olivapovliticus]PRY82270.1 hypothetical protein CLV38_1137 [Alkalibacterium olivapovliticus]
MMPDFIDYGWLNIGSLIFGIIAWSIPASSILNTKKIERPISVKVLLSLSACATALWFQLAYTTYLVQIQDWGALEDTTFTLNWGAAILLVVTIGLNILSLKQQMQRVHT